jgi:hypothetical protein
MEDLLQNIIKDASGKQLQNLKQAAQIAHGEDFGIFPPKKKKINKHIAAQ